MDLQDKTFTWHDKYCEPNIETHVFSCQVDEDETYKNMLNQLSFIPVTVFLLFQSLVFALYYLKQ